MVASLSGCVKKVGVFWDYWFLGWGLLWVFRNCFHARVLFLGSGSVIRMKVCLAVLCGDVWLALSQFLYMQLCEMALFHLPVLGQCQTVRSFYFLCQVNLIK